MNSIEEEETLRYQYPHFQRLRPHAVVTLRTENPNYPLKNLIPTPPQMDMSQNDEGRNELKRQYFYQITKHTNFFDYMLSKFRKSAKNNIKLKKKKFSGP